MHKNACSCSLPLNREETPRGSKAEGSVSAPRTAGRATSYTSTHPELTVPPARLHARSPIACCRMCSDRPLHLHHAVKCTFPRLNCTQRSFLTWLRGRRGRQGGEEAKTERKSRAEGVPVPHHKVPTSELSASAIFRRSSKQRDECLNPMRAGEI